MQNETAVDNWSKPNGSLEETNLHTRALNHLVSSSIDNEMLQRSQKSLINFNLCPSNVVTCATWNLEG